MEGKGKKKDKGDRNVNGKRGKKRGQGKGREGKRREGKEEELREKGREQGT